MLYLEHPFYLRRGDFDQYERILPSAVLEILQEIAILQSNSDNTGPHDLFERGGFWVITRMKFKILKQPRPSQEVVASTWPHSPTRLTIKRDFTISDSNGQPLIIASSEWMILNTLQRKVANIADFYEVEREFHAERNFDEKLKKLPDFEIAQLEPYEVKPGYCDIDMNGHLNNTRYATYAINALKPSNKSRLSSMQIDFRQEVMPTEDLAVYAMVADNTALVKGLKDAQTTAFVAQIEFEV